MKKRLLIFLLACSSLSVFAQDPEFTQFYAAPLYLNPAFAGSARCPRVILNYRNQWPALTGTYVTYAASYDQHIDALQGGLGLLVVSDRAGMGIYNKSFVSGIYSYSLNITRKFSIKVGFQGSYYQFSVDWDKLNFGDQIHPRYGFIYNSLENRPPSEKLSYVDFSAGILGYSSKVYGGVAVNHLTSPDESFLKIGETSPLPMKITAHFGALIPTNDSRNSPSYISPNILFQQQQDFTQINFGLYVSKGPLVGGLWFRTGLHNGDALIALVGVQQGMFKFGYSYDATLSRLVADTAGSHEISFALQFECRPKKRKFRTISCPSF